MLIASDSVVVSDGPALSLMEAAGCHIEVGLLDSVSDLRAHLAHVRGKRGRVAMLVQCDSTLVEEYLKDPDPLTAGTMNHLVMVFVPEDGVEIDPNRLGDLCGARYANLYSTRRSTQAALVNALTWLRESDALVVLWPRERGVSALIDLVEECRAAHPPLKATIRG